MSNPLLTRPGVVERAPGLVHLCLRDALTVAGYQFWGSNTVDDAYGDPTDSGVGGAGPTALFTVGRGLGFRSPALRRSGRGQIIGSTKGQTHVVFDPADFNTPGAGLPPDDQFMFIRVQENRAALGFLALPGIPEATITLAGVGVGDRITIKGIVFDFAAGANDLAGKAGTVGDPFLVGLGASDNFAAANLTAALNDNGDVSPAMDLVVPLLMHTFATNPGAPSAVVVVQPEDAGATLLLGNAGTFTITTSNQGLMALDADALAAGTLVWDADPLTPVLGSIFVLPSATHFGRRDPSFTLEGTAPSSTTSAAGFLPVVGDDLGSAAPRALHLVFPGWLSEVSIRNLSAVNLLVCFGPGQPMRTVAAGLQLALTSGKAGVKEVLLACPDGVAGAAFTLHAVSQTEM